MTSPIISRYQRIEGPPQRHPHKCVCGAGTKDWYVDLRFKTNKWDGSIFLCNDCVNQIALEQGYIPAEEVTSLQNSYDLLNKKHHETLAEVDRLHAVLDSLRSVGIRLDPGVVNELPVPEGTEPVVNQVGIGESGTVESDSQWRPSDVSANDDDDDLQAIIDSI